MPRSLLIRIACLKFSMFFQSMIVTLGLFYAHVTVLKQFYQDPVAALKLFFQDPGQESKDYKVFSKYDHQIW